MRPHHQLLLQHPTILARQLYHRYCHLQLHPHQFQPFHPICKLITEPLRLLPLCLTRESQHIHLHHHMDMGRRVQAGPQAGRMGMARELDSTAKLAMGINNLNRIQVHMVDIQPATGHHQVISVSPLRKQQCQALRLLCLMLWRTFHLNKRYVCSNNLGLSCIVPSHFSDLTSYRL